MTEEDRKDFEWASGYYLYDDLDADWVNWDEEKLHNEIEKLADGVRQYINKENK